MLSLDTYLPYLVNRAGSQMVARFSNALRAHGIGIQEWRVLALLHQGDGLRLSEIAERSSIEISTLSRLASAMQARGLIERSRDAEDGRALAILMLPAGSSIVEKLLPAALDLERQALAGLGPDEVAQLKVMLEKVFLNLRD